MHSRPSGVEVPSVADTMPVSSRRDGATRRAAAAVAAWRSVLPRVGAVLALCSIALLPGCSTIAEYDETRGWSAAKIYAEARDEMLSRNYERAIKLYNALEARFPYGRHSQQAMLETAYSQWKDNDNAAALATLDRFQKLYPTHPSADYAWYLRGLINFNDDMGLLGTLTRQDFSERDPRAARQAFEAFRELLVRFPESKYAPDAAARLKHIVNSLASNEVHVARFYLRRGAFVAAINRAQSALTTYPQTPANEEALLILVKAYDALGLTDLRDDAERVMRRNFPDSRYFKVDLTRDTRRWWQFW